MRGHDEDGSFLVEKERKGKRRGGRWVEMKMKMSNVFCRFWAVRDAIVRPRLER